MNAISFSLYVTHAGEHPGIGEKRAPFASYAIGAVRNAQLISEIYPKWQMVVYHAPEVPQETLQALAKLGVDLRPTPGCSMFHRFLINDDLKVERYLVRDADSRLNKREAGAVAEWIESGKSFHVIRDHPHHPQPMQGGLWGGTTGKFLMLGSPMSTVNMSDRSYGADMRFLAQRVWPEIKDDCLQHDLCTWRQYVGAKPFPASFGDMRFAGEVFDQDDTPRRGDWQRRANYLTT